MRLREKSAISDADRSRRELACNGKFVQIYGGSATPKSGSVSPLQTLHRIVHIWRLHNQHDIAGRIAVAAGGPQKKEREREREIAHFVSPL